MDTNPTPTAPNNLLKLENQLCFPFYAVSRQLTKAYQPYLQALGLTYPQYLVFLLLWEHEQLTVKDLGEKLLLDSGT
ncbi:MAG: MarR family transcriptional regulator, partial [Hymenobacter sp.]